MSFEAAAWAIKQKTETPVEKLVLIALADCYNKNNSRCDPSKAHIAEIALCSERYVSGAIASLVEQGFISVDRKTGRRSNYNINMTPELSSPHPRTEFTPTPELSSETPELSSPEPVRTSKLTSKIPIPDFINKKMWSDFLEMRGNKKNTDISLKRIINRLIDFKAQGMDVNQILDNSIISSWAGVFPIKDFKLDNQPPERIHGR